MSDKNTTKTNKFENIYSALVHLSGGVLCLIGERSYSFGLNFLLCFILLTWLPSFIMLITSQINSKIYLASKLALNAQLNFLIFCLMLFLVAPIFIQILMLVIQTEEVTFVIWFVFPFLAYILGFGITTYNILLSIYGAFRAYQGKEFKYPLTFKFLK